MTKTAFMLNVLRVWAWFSLGLHLASYFLPQTYFWSIWPYSRWPIWLGTFLAAVAGLSLIPNINQRMQSVIAQIWNKLPSKGAPYRWFILLASVSLPLFWGARIRHLLWGDAAILVVGLSHPEQTVIYNWQAPLTVFLHQRLWALFFYPRYGWGVETVYALISVICGGLFVFATLAFANRLGQNVLEKMLIGGLVLTTGTMQLFFGYVENYTIISVWLILFMWLSVKMLDGDVRLWPVVLTLSVTNAFHPSTVFLWPAVLYLVWVQYQRGTPVFPLLLEVLLPPFLIANSVLTLMELGDHGLDSFLGDDRPGGGDHIWFVPLFETQSSLEQYTMFSSLHLIEWLNEHYLISTFGLFLLLVCPVWLWRNRQTISIATQTQSHLRFLGLVSFCYLALTWLWNADYGVRKDWDLFSPSAIVYTTFAALLLIQSFQNDKAALAQSVLFILTISGLHTASWVYTNMHFILSLI